MERGGYHCPQCDASPPGIACASCLKKGSRLALHVSEVGRCCVTGLTNGMGIGYNKISEKCLNFGRVESKLHTKFLDSSESCMGKALPKFTMQQPGLACGFKAGQMLACVLALQGLLMNPEDQANHYSTNEKSVNIWVIF